jgi:hypothetical protein
MEKERWRRRWSIQMRPRVMKGWPRMIKGWPRVMKDRF